MNQEKGQILIIVVSMVFVLAIIAGAIGMILLNEINLIKRHTDLAKATFLAEAGVQKMCAYLKAQGDTEMGVWEDQEEGPPFGTQFSYRSVYHIDNASLGNGTYSVRAYTNRGATEDLVIRCESAVRDSSYVLIATYSKGPKSPWDSCLASNGDIALAGHKQSTLFGWKNSWVTIDGPINCNGVVTTNDRVVTNGTVTPNACMPMPQFTETIDRDLDQDGTPETYKVDLNEDGVINQYSDVNGDLNPMEASFQGETPGTVDRVDRSGPSGVPDGKITKDDNPYDAGSEPAEHAAWDAEFDADDQDANNEIDEEDGFRYYYEDTLNAGVNPGTTGVIDSANYYTGDQQFGPLGIVLDTIGNSDIVYVDGDVDIALNASGWWNGSRDITIVATGNVNILEPLNGDDDRLNIITYGDVCTGGISIGGLLDGNTNIYAHNTVYAVYGGCTTGTILGFQGIDVDTVLTSWLGLYNRNADFNSNLSSNQPLGWPLFPTDTTLNNPAYLLADFKIGNRQSWERK